MNEENGFFIHKGTQPQKKEGNLAICNNTQDPAGIMLSEVSQTKTD